MGAILKLDRDETIELVRHHYPELLRPDHAGSAWRGDDGRRPWEAYIRDFEDIVRGPRMRLDAGETATFRGALTSMLSEVLMKRYPALRAQEFIPMNTEAHPGARKIKVVGYEGMAKATRLTNYATDVPLAEVQGEDDDINVTGVCCAWAVGFQQLREMALARQNGYTADIDSIGVSMARLAVLTELDDILSNGDEPSGIEGFVSHSGITPTAVTTGAWDGGVTTVAQTLSDILELRAAGRATGVWEPDTMLLPEALYGYFTTTMIPNTSMSLLTWLREQLPWLSTISEWRKLNTAAVGGGGRVILYQKTPEVIRGFIPVSLEALPPIDERLRTVTIFHARCAGVHSANQSALIFCDNAKA